MHFPPNIFRLHVHFVSANKRLVLGGFKWEIESFWTILGLEST